MAKDNFKKFEVGLSLTENGYFNNRIKCRVGDSIKLIITIENAILSNKKIDLLSIMDTGDNKYKLEHKFEEGGISVFGDVIQVDMKETFTQADSTIITEVVIYDEDEILTTNKLLTIVEPTLNSAVITEVKDDITTLKVLYDLLEEYNEDIYNFRGSMASFENRIAEVEEKYNIINIEFEENMSSAKSAEETRETNENRRQRNELERIEFFESANISEAERVDAEESRKTSETNRENEFSQAQTDRANTFNASQEEMKNSFDSSQDSRAKSFDNSQLDRTNKFNRDQLDRTTAFDSSQNDRANEYNASQTDRANEFTEAQKSREDAYIASEEDRNRLYLSAESDRSSEFESSQSGRVETFNAAERNRASTFERAEASRVETFNLAEERRQTGFDSMVEENETFKTNINEQYDNIVTENNTFKDDVIKKTGNLEVGYFDKKEYPNAKDSTDASFEHLNREINKANLIPYSGSSIKGENSYKGMTSDMLLKGMTLQNLMPKFDKNDFSGVHDTPQPDLFYKHEKGVAIEKTKTERSVSISRSPNSKMMIFKKNTLYTLIVDVFENTITSESSIILLNSYLTFMPTLNVTLPNGFTGRYIQKFTTKSEFSETEPYNIYIHGSGIGKLSMSNYLIIEGDHTQNPPTSYFEGIQSVGETEMVGDKYKIGVGSCGKNLMNLEYLDIDMYSISNGGYIHTEGKRSNCRIKGLKPSTRYIISIGEVIGQGCLGFRAEVHSNGVKIADKNAVTLHPFYFTTPSDTSNIDIMFWSSRTQNGIQADMTGCGVTNLMIEEAITGQTQPSEYQPFVSNKKYILSDSPLMGLPNGACNTVSELGVEERRVGKYVLDGSENFILDQGNELYRSFLIRNHISKAKVSTKCISNKLPYKKNLYNLDGEGVVIGGTRGDILIFILKSKLQSDSVSGLKQLLQQWKSEGQPLEIYCEVSEPITIDHKTNINLDTYEPVTYIESTNSMKSKVECKVPTNVQAMVSNLRSENNKLSNELTVLSIENEQLKDDLDASVKALQCTDSDIIATSWDTDFRLCEVEWTLEDFGVGQPITLSIDNKLTKGGIVMALSRYEQAKIMILGGKYNKETLTYQLTTYLKREYLTQEEYDELIALMEAREMVEVK